MRDYQQKFGVWDGLGSGIYHPVDLLSFGDRSGGDLDGFAQKMPA